MNKIFLLIKYDLVMLLNRITKNKKSSIGKSIGTLIIVLLAFVYFIWMLLFQSMLMLEGLVGSGYESIIITRMILMYSFSVLLFVINNSVVLNEKDSDFLLSVPIRKQQIIISKSLIKYLAYLLIGFVTVIPTVVLYILKMNTSFILLLNSILLVMILALIFVSLSYLFNAFINFIIVKVKYYKLIRMVIVLSSIFGFLYFYMMFMSNVNILDIVVFSDLTTIITKNNYMLFIIIFLISIPLFSISTFIFSKLYGQKTKTYKNVNQEIKVSKKNTSALKSLVLKEFKNYFSSSIYIMNTIIGNIIMIAGSIYLLFDNPLGSDMLTQMIYLVICFSLALGCTSNSSVSLEGKNFWIIKSAPVKYETVMFSKVFMNLILLVTSITISFILLLISNRIDIIELISLYILGVLNSVFVSFGGILVNMYLPKLDFKNEMQVVKQSASATISILGFTLFLSTPAFLYMLGIIELELSALIFINIGYILILDVLLVVGCFKLSSRLLSELD